MSGKHPLFNTLIESVIYHIADVQGLWVGFENSSWGIYAEVILNAEAIAVMDFIMPDADTMPRYWIVQKKPTVRCFAFDSMPQMQEEWIDAVPEYFHAPWTTEPNLTS